MANRPSTGQLVCAVLLILVVLTAGCPNPWQSTSYHAYGKVVAEPPENVTVLSHDDNRIRREEVIQQVVAEAIVTYENQTGTDVPRRLYHTRRTLSENQFQKTSDSIEEIGSSPTSNITGGENAEAVIYVRRAGYVVRVWTGKMVSV